MADLPIYEMSNWHHCLR